MHDVCEFVVIEMLLRSNCSADAANFYEIARIICRLRTFNDSFVLVSVCRLVFRNVPLFCVRNFKPNFAGRKRTVVSDFTRFYFCCLIDLFFIAIVTLVSVDCTVGTAA